MDPIRKRLVELREELVRCHCSGVETIWYAGWDAHKQESKT